MWPASDSRETPLSTTATSGHTDDLASVRKLRQYVYNHLKLTVLVNKQKNDTARVEAFMATADASELVGLSRLQVQGPRPW